MALAPPSAPPKAVQVAVRLRPALDDEAGDSNAASVVENETQGQALRVAMGAAYRDFAFPRVLGPDVAQRDVLEASGWAALLEQVFHGYAATIIAYGQTGSGKTFSMSGRDEQRALHATASVSATDDDDGIAARSLGIVFEHAATSGASVSATYLEVYNELVFDLFNDDDHDNEHPATSAAADQNADSLPVRYDAKTGFYVPGLRERPLTSIAHARKLLLRGARARRVRATRGNRDSSRSHSIFTVQVRVPHAGGGALPPLLGKAVFVDLAGSERLSSDGAAKDAAKETGSINRSLFALSKVISKLGAVADTGDAAATGGSLQDDATGRAHVPYRDSTLTKLLRDSLGGNSLALLLACVSPSARHTDETLSTLYYAARAMNIRNRPIVRVASGDLGPAAWGNAKGAAGSAASWLPRSGSANTVAHAVAAATSDMHRELTLLRAENARLRASVERTPRDAPGVVVTTDDSTGEADSQAAAEEAVRRATELAFSSDDTGKAIADVATAEANDVEKGTSDIHAQLAEALAEVARLREQAQEERGRWIALSIENEELRRENEELRAGEGEEAAAPLQAQGEKTVTPSTFVREEDADAWNGALDNIDETAAPEKPGSAASDAQARFENQAAAPTAYSDGSDDSNDEPAWYEVEAAQLAADVPAESDDEPHVDVWQRPATIASSVTAPPLAPSDPRTAQPNAGSQLPRVPLPAPAPVPAPAPPADPSASKDSTPRHAKAAADPPGSFSVVPEPAAPPKKRTTPRRKDASSEGAITMTSRAFDLLGI